MQHKREVAYLRERVRFDTVYESMPDVCDGPKTLDFLPNLWQSRSLSFDLGEILGKLTSQYLWLHQGAALQDRQWDQTIISDLVRD